MRAIIVFAAVAAISVGARAAEPPRAERAALMKAAGIASERGCAAGEPSWPASRFTFDFPDLNGDGVTEAIVSEENVACHGNAGTAFTVLARVGGGGWRKLGEGAGAPFVLGTRRGGWLDIEVGGPGMGTMPVLRWTGSGYATPR